MTNYRVTVRINVEAKSEEAAKLLVAKGLSYTSAVQLLKTINDYGSVERDWQARRLENAPSDV